MTMPPTASGESPADGCAEPRAAVTTLCDQAHVARDAYIASSEHIRGLRRDLVAAQHQYADAVAAADPGLRSAEKAKAREAYQRARQLADGESELAEAAATWARAIDNINRSGRLAQRAVSRTRSTVAQLENAVREAERAEQTARIQAEAAEAACLDARVRLASCEEQAQAVIRTEPGAAPQAHAATGGHASAIGQIAAAESLVIESMVSGDRHALELAAEQVSDHTGLPTVEAQLQLEELVDAIVSSASAEGFLIFDTRLPFWACLSFEESRDVVAALARLGFQLEPAEGWHAGRAPSPVDLSMALAYAGLDARNMRDLPDSAALQDLPQSIGVDARAFLAAQASDLAVDHMVRILDRRAEQLEPLWNEWGQVRPILLSDRHSLESLSG